MISLNGIKITPTIFPDGTSQVWKLSNLSPISNHILWNFENEAEVFHVMQLLSLINANYLGSAVLEIPFLPYARQDKEISNESTFAGRVLISMLDSLPVRVVVTDAHNPQVLPRHWHNRMPNAEVEAAIKSTNSDYVVFPDKGAAKRGYSTANRSSMVLDKVRDPLTGDITGLAVVGPLLNWGGKSCIIVDDICDGGRTFTEAAKLLYNLGLKDVYLFTTHGIYSKGTSVLKEAGIKRIFNKNGEIL